HFIKTMHTQDLLAVPDTRPDATFEPAFRGKVWFRATPGLSDLIFCASPRAADVPCHLHRTMTETFTVLEGQLDVFMQGHWHAVTTGQTFTVPPGRVHTIRNSRDYPCLYRCQVSPGKRFEELIRMYAALIGAGRLKSIREPRSLVYAGLMYDHFRDVQTMTGLTGRLLYGLARLGKLLGYQLPTLASTVPA
ncbi:MAG TPA: cupin domain-containing protein, partial [Cytophagales bacterium]